MSFDTLPASIHESLMDFQVEGVKFGLEHGGRLLLGDEMGLGKTLQAIAIAAGYADDWPCLVVVPASLKYSWADELEKWLPGRLGPADVAIVRSRSDVANLSDAKFVIVSYGMFTNGSAVVDAIAAAKFQVVICDESHMLKNPKAARTKLLMPIMQDAKRLLLLSGTPALGRPEELFVQASCLAPTLFPKSFWEFAKRYCNARRSRFGWDTSGASNLDELHSKLSTFMIRRLKADVLSELPYAHPPPPPPPYTLNPFSPKTYRRVELELTPKELKTAQELRSKMNNARDLMAALADDATASEAFKLRGEHHSLLMQAYQEAGLAKVDAAARFVVDQVDGGARVLVFGHHRAVLDGMQTALVRKKIKHIRIDGSTPPVERHQHVKAYLNDDTVSVALLSMTAAGQGITFAPAATHVTFVELTWVPGVLQQAEDRAHRIGAKHNINVSYLLAPDTCDDLLWRLIKRKVGVVSRVLDGTRKAMPTMEASTAGCGSTPAAREVGSDGEVAGAGAGVEPVASPAAFPKGDVRRALLGAAPTPWRCAVCTLDNPAPRSTCGACGAPHTVDLSQDDDVPSTPRAPLQVSSPTDSPPTAAATPPCSLHFAVSASSKRCFAYDGDKRPLEPSFHFHELDDGGVPPALSGVVGGPEAAVRFVKSWAKLRGVDKTVLFGKIVQPPLMPLVKRYKRGGSAPATICFQRFVNDAPKASPPPPTPPVLPPVAVPKAVVVLDGADDKACKQCGGVLPPGIPTEFCSHECKEEFSVKRDGAFVRRALFELEAGVCQLCGVDAHALYGKVKALSPPERLSALSGFLKLGKGARVLTAPKEGDFWQADHWKPVSEGGGQCDMSNYRTLCTPCHLKETSKLRVRLADKKRAAAAVGTKDIRSMFKRLKK